MKRLQNNKLIRGNCYEHEAARLLRCISSLGDGRLNDPQSWDLHLTTQERERAKQTLQSLEPDFRFIACSIGTKVDVKNWGSQNWRKFISQLYSNRKGYGLVLIGSKEEFEYSERVSRSWLGPKLNLCGMLTPRESAVVLKMAILFVGHDSGPMHLAASVGTPCAAIFSARNKPGVWFPYGKSHNVIYNQVECYGCELDMCEQERKKCISSITPEEVLETCNQVLSNCNIQL
jgi:ADP-heptose:LPS heptosyltransferase